MAGGQVARWPGGRWVPTGDGDDEDPVLVLAEVLQPLLGIVHEIALGEFVYIPGLGGLAQ